MEEKKREWRSYLGVNIEDYLRRTKTTLSQLSTATGIPKATLSNWMNYKRDAKVSVSLRKLSLYLNVSIDELCFSFCFRSQKRTSIDTKRIEKHIKKTRSELPDLEQLALSFE